MRLEVALAAKMLRVAEERWKLLFGVIESFFVRLNHGHYPEFLLASSIALVEHLLSKAIKTKQENKLFG